MIIFSVVPLLAACSVQTPIPREEPDENMAGFPCHFMSGRWMGDCTFDEDGNPVMNNMPMMMGRSGETFSRSIDNLPEAKPSEIVYLRNGDTYTMQAGMVKQEVGNKTIKRLAYNGQIPGPLLKVDQGAEVTLRFENMLDVETTLHSHGLRLDNAFDGVPDVTQKAIKPGETFTYQLKFPDAGIYWYHPHIREDYTQELGLYGNMMVEPNSPDYWAPVDREEVLLLDDILVNENQPVFNTDHTTHSLMGRFGNTMLVNNEEEYEMKVKQDETLRFYITNVANTRVFNVSFPGAQMKLVGSDVGRIEREVPVDSVVVAPAERMIVEIRFPEKGTYDIIHQTPDTTYTLGRIIVEGETETVGNFDQLRNNLSDYELIRSNAEQYLQQKPDKSLRLSINMPAMGMMMADDDHVEGIEWEDTMPQMNAMSTSDMVTWQIIDEETGKENMDIDWSFKQGDLVKIRIFNDPKSMHPMQHPIHFHGQRFVVLARDGELNDNLSWKDTALVETGETVDLLVEMSNPGVWMAHCHIAEHLHSGMMFKFQVQ